MRRGNRYIVYFLSALVDAALTLACFVVVSRLYLGTSTAVAAAGYTRWDSLALYVVAAYSLALSAAYALLRVYGNVYYGRAGRMAGIIVLTNSAGLIAISAAFYAFKLIDISRMTLALFFLSSTAAVIIKHWLEIRVLLRRRREPGNQIPVIVVGSGPLAQRYAEAMDTNPTRFEQVIGHVCATDKPAPGIDAQDKAEPPHLGPCLGSVCDLEQILASADVAQVVLALEAEEYPFAGEAMAAAEKRGVYVRLVPFYSDFIPGSPSIESVQDLRLIDVRTTAFDNPLTAAIKRLLDILISLAIIVVISPVFVAVAIGVRLSSPGPVLFLQDRIGRGRRPFKMLKFRSMRMANDPISAFSEDKDARKTTFGSFLRRYSLDELPQFFNVLAGQMSIVGPRPVVAEEADAYREHIPLYMLRYQVRPGITGWAQINGYRGNNSIQAVRRRTEFDLYYIEHWSLLLDAQIFLRTIFGGFRSGERIVR